jgi:hypothetical protein
MVILLDDQWTNRRQRGFDQGLAALVLSSKKNGGREIIPHRNEAETAIRNSEI